MIPNVRTEVGDLYSKDKLQERLEYACLTGEYAGIINRLGSTLATVVERRIMMVERRLNKWNSWK
jgi:hypothetical protein